MNAILTGHKATCINREGFVLEKNTCRNLLVRNLIREHSAARIRIQAIEYVAIGRSKQGDSRHEKFV